MTKTDNKKEQARLYYMSGLPQKEVAEKVGTSKQTINKWVKDGNWAERRAAEKITRPELVNKILLSIDKLIEDSLSDPAKTINSDQLSKLAAAITNLDKKANVVDVTEVFISAGRFLQKQIGLDPKITPEALKVFTHCQDVYINRLLSSDIE